MVRRDIAELAVYEICEGMEVVPFCHLRDLFLKKTSDIIYIIAAGKLYGIISLKETLYCSQGDEVRINRSFTVLTGYNVIKAQEIFQRKPYIRKIPVVNEQGELLGDYSQWDDLLYIEYNIKLLSKKESAEKVLLPCGELYVIKPIDKKRNTYKCFTQYWDHYLIPYTILDKEQAEDKLPEDAVCIFTDEDEKRGTMCLHKMRLCSYGEERGVFWDTVRISENRIVRFATYKSILQQIEKNDWNEALNIHLPRKFVCSKVDEKAVFLLSKLQSKGIKCYCLLYENEKRDSDYWIKFDHKLRERLLKRPISMRTPWTKGEEDKDFYGELLQNEDYIKGTAQEEIFNGVRSFQYKKNITGKYFNAQNGKRITCFKPEQYIGTIYIMGMCMIVGRHVEDQYTISSYLQKMLSEKGYPYRVENFGVVSRRDAALDSRLEEIERFRPGDIVIYQSSVGELPGIPGISTGKIFEENNIPVEWTMDTHGHCNHMVNKEIAKSLFEMIVPNLSHEMTDADIGKKICPDIYGMMQEYVQCKYINRYFSDFSAKENSKVGAIVMKCSPFHLGHRYLIEQALHYVDELILFIIDDGRYASDFEDRFKMVSEGVKDLDHILVVPCGDFIFSMNNFSEYYIKKEEEAAAINAEYDVTVFADYIAKPLHITHRFAGEETSNSIKKVYNKAMKAVLPQKNIVYMEFPKMMQNGEIICSNKIRKYLRKEEYQRVFALVPESTERYLKKQLDMEKGNKAAERRMS